MGTSWKGALVLLVLGLTVPWYFTNSRRTDPKFPDSMDQKATVLNTPLDHDSVVDVTRSLTRKTLSSLINQRNNFSWASQVSKQANVRDHNFTDESFFDFQMEHGDEGHQTAGKGTSLNQTSSTDGQFILTPSALMAEVQGEGYALVQTPILEVVYSKVYIGEYEKHCPKKVQVRFSDLSKKGLAKLTSGPFLTISLGYSSLWKLERNTITTGDQYNGDRHVDELGDRHIASVSMSLNIDYNKMKQKKITELLYGLNDKMQDLLAAAASVEKSAVSVSISGSGGSVKVDAEIQTPNPGAVEDVKTKLTGIENVNAKVSNAVDSIPGKEQWESGKIKKRVTDFVTADPGGVPDPIVAANSLQMEVDGGVVVVRMSLNVAHEIKQQKMTQKLGMLEYALQTKIEGVLAEQAGVDYVIVTSPPGRHSKVQVEAEIRPGGSSRSEISEKARTIADQMSMSEKSEDIALKISEAVKAMPPGKVSESGDKTYAVREFVTGDLIAGSFEVTAKKVVSKLNDKDKKEYAKLKELLEAGTLGMEVKALMLVAKTLNIVTKQRKNVYKCQ